MTQNKRKPKNRVEITEIKGRYFATIMGRNNSVLVMLAGMGGVPMCRIGRKIYFPLEWLQQNGLNVTAPETWQRV